MAQTLASLYGWTPEQIGSLTLAQVCGYMGVKDANLVTFNSVREAMTYLARMKEAGGK